MADENKKKAKRKTNSKTGKKALTCRVVFAEAKKWGITDFEYSLIQKMLVDPQMSATKAYLELKYDALDLPRDPERASREGTKIMRRDRVRAYFKDCLEKRMDLGVVTQKEILYRIMALAHRCEYEGPILNEIGDIIAFAKPDNATALKAWHLLGKNLGMFSDKIELTGEGGGPIRTIDESMTQKEAIAIYEQNIKNK